MIDTKGKVLGNLEVSYRECIFLIASIDQAIGLSDAIFNEIPKELVAIRSKLELLKDSLGKDVERMDRIHNLAK